MLAKLIYLTDFLNYSSLSLSFMVNEGEVGDKWLYFEVKRGVSRYLGTVIYWTLRTKCNLHLANKHESFYKEEK